MYVSSNNDKFNVSYSTISQGDWFCHFLLQFYITQTVKYNRSVKTNSLNNCIISMKFYSVYTEYLQYVCMMGFGNCFVLLSTGRGHTCMLRYCDKKNCIYIFINIDILNFYLQLFLEQTFVILWLSVENLNYLVHDGVSLHVVNLHKNLVFTMTVVLKLYYILLLPDYNQVHLLLCLH